MILKNRGEGKRKGVGAILVLAVFVGTAAFAPLSASSGVGGFSGFGEVSEFSSEGNGSTLVEWTQNHTVKVNSTTTYKYEQGVLRLNETYTGSELRERFGVERFTKELEIPVEGREAETLGLEEGEEKEFVAEREVVLTREEEPPHWWDEYDYPQWVWLKSGEIYEQNLPINIAWKGTTKNRAKSEILEEEGWVDDPVEYTEYVYDREKGWIRDDGVADSKYGVFGRNHTLLWQLSDGNVVANAHHDKPVPHEADELEEAEERVAGFFGEPEDTEWLVHEDSYDLGNSVTTPHSNGLCTEINYKYVPEEEWNKTFGGTGYDSARSVQQTTDGGYILVGSKLIKTDSDGNMLWNKSLGCGESVQQTSDGGYIIVGCIWYDYGDYNICFIKTDSDGNIEWDKVFGGGSSYEWGLSVQQTSDGGYIIGGYTTADYGLGGSCDVLLIKTDSKGIKEWERTFKKTYIDGFCSVQQTSDGGYIITDEGRYGGVWLIKTDLSGSKEWEKTFGSSASGNFVQQTLDGGYIITGDSGYSRRDIYLIKTDSKGNKEWDNAFGGSDYDVGYSVQQTTDGGYILTGRTASYGAGSSDAWLIKTDSGGNEQWNKTFGGSHSDCAYSVQQTRDGGYIIAGLTASYGAGSSDAWLIKVKGEEPAEPAISIQTDKREYSPGETMTVTLGFKNPTASSVKANFIWYLDWLPILSTALTLPPKCEQSYEFSIPVGEWSPVGFEAAWYVALLEQAAPHETICEDSAAWRFVPTAATTAATTTQTQVPKEVAEQIARELEVEREEFAAA